MLRNENRRPQGRQLDALDGNAQGDTAGTTPVCLVEK